MTKGYILTVALLLSLPACTRKKDTAVKPAKANTTKKYIENGAVLFDLDERDEDEKDEDIMNLFEDEEEDEEELSPSEREAMAELNREMAEEDTDEFTKETDEEDDVFTWVDAQVDDEFKTVHFDFNHYGIKADQKKLVQHDIEQAKQLIAQVDTQANLLIVVEGHADQEGTPAYNLSLSEKRAKNVADLFVEAGIDKSIIKVVGRGQEVPVVANAQTREERAPNRRVDVRVIYT